VALNVTDVSVDMDIPLYNYQSISAARRVGLAARDYIVATLIADVLFEQFLIHAAV